jgi:hypothetical protein
MMAASDPSYPVSNAKGHPFMKQNSLTWLAMFLSVVAGMFCSQLASKYTDGKIEAAISIPSNLNGTNSTATVALSRDVSAFRDSAKN